jgi:hypothetical protein
VKATRVCSIDGCDRAHGAKGMCDAHYGRWRRNGTTTTTRKRPCSIDGCDKLGNCGGVCKMHRSRFSRTGSYELTRVRARGCSVADCVREHQARGYCAMHYSRWQTHGDPNVVAKAMNYGDEVGYVGAHARVRRSRGKAAAFPCSQGCGNVAAHWAYDHLDPDEKVGEDHGYRVPFSVDPAHYVPMCTACHKAFDLAHIAAV